MDLPIIYEDNHLLVINKPAGVLVQGDQTGDQPLVEVAKSYIKEKYNKPGAVFLGVVHRIDRPVSGLVIFARTSKALERMNGLFRERNVVKKYLAIVQGQPSQDNATLVHWLKKNPSLNKTTAFLRETEGALRSELSYRVLQTTGSHSLLEIIPVTGRSHQIRVQLSAIGYPIVGDIKYGGMKGDSARAICLHAAGVSFPHPTTKEMLNLQAPVLQGGIWAKFQSIYP